MARIFSLLLALFLCQASMPLMAQDDASQVPFNGIITDIAGKPVKNAKIYVVNDRYYARTDKEGKFGLTNVQPDDTLHVKFKKEVYDIPVNGRKSIRIHLGDQLLSDEDDELVSFGYGWVKRRESTNVSNGISGDILRRIGKPNLLDCMVGLVPGVSIQDGKVVIRGIATINASTDPLFMVDNIEVSSLDFINVNDVDHVEVLKDASIYGARGANGAILVFTKRGK